VNQYSLIYPMFAMVILTFTILGIMFRSRVRALKKGEIGASFYKTYRGDTEPDSIAQLSRQFSNIFETPVLFYAACLTAMITGQSGTILQLLAWVYVVSRVAHFFIHTGSNKLRTRVAAFFVSCVAIAAMWVTLTIGVATAG